MINIFYTIFIFPIELLIELAYLFIFRVFNNPAVSLFGVSFAVSVLTLPLYFMAEKHQRAEQDIQKRMKPEIDNLKAVFSGDERFMRLAVYYRQNGYHPLSSLRSSISLIIQIPFFIAAYHFISNLEVIKNISFGPINDLAKPDSLITIKGFVVNILPIIMTIISCVSAGIYTKGFPVKDKIQLYGMAAIFMVLLYNSPSGMVLYWTGNNLFSLVKNLIQKTKNPKRVTHIIVSVFCFPLLPYLLFIHDGWIVKRIFISFIFGCIPFIPFLSSFFSRKIQTLSIFRESRENTRNTVVFLLSMFILFLLGGLVIPSSLIASSVTEFSFIENYKTPFPFILHAVLQSFGIFLLWPVCIYCLFPLSTKTKIAKLMAVITGIVVIDAVLFPGTYGHMSILFIIADNFNPKILLYLLNLLVVIIAAVLILLLVHRFRKIMVTVMAITACAFVIVSSINNIKIYREFKSLQLRLQSFQSQPQQEDGISLPNEYTFNFSTDGRNVLVIMLDRGISAFIPYIFEEKPELYNSFDGFTWYKNTISFGAHTNFGSPGIFGGYEYTPLEMQSRKDVSLVDKHNEALLLLPRIFLEYDFTVTVTDPPFANYEWVPDLSIFSDYPQIKAENIEGKYTDEWLKDKGDAITMGKVAGLIKSNLIRFSFFKFVPLLFRNFVYDNGCWLAVDAEIVKIFPFLTLSSYVILDFLPKITKINQDQSDNFNLITNNLTHDPHLLQAPEYVPVDVITDTENGLFANDASYHVNIASLLLLGEYFDFLKENNAYDNSRIIIVSDHGDLTYSGLKNTVLPNGESLHSYTALLMVKDFNTHGLMAIEDSFMTNSDVPLIALNDIVENPVNPWTGKILSSNKENGVTITTSHNWDIIKHSKYYFSIKPNEWLHVHSNIFDPNNWSEVRK